MSTSSSSSRPSVAFPNGATITGTTETNASGKQVHVFRGIPYAEPPIGDHRWKQATLKAISADVDATAFKNVAFGDPHIDSQAEMFPISEDCLFLNVYTPAEAESTSRLPVMVWLHGGIFASGAGYGYDGSNIVSSASGKRVVYVSINYRLGVFGFLSNDALLDEGDGVNYGLRDQETAFKWIKQHIAYFGGDPSNITAFGHSVGGKSIGLHMVSRDGKQQSFHKAIAQSGFMTSSITMHSTATQNEMTLTIARKLGYPGSSVDASLLSFLRQSDAKELWEAGSQFLWQPVVDRVFLLDAPSRCLMGGNVSRIPTIIGTTSDEGFVFTFGVKTDADVDSYLRSRLSALTKEELDRVHELYPSTAFSTPQLKVAEIEGDAFYVFLSEFGSIENALHGDPTEVPTYRYRFNEASSDFGIPLVNHGAELDFVFNLSITRLFNKHAPPLDFSEAQAHLAKSIRTFWTDFAATGSPNGDAVCKWPRFDMFARRELVIESSGLRTAVTGAERDLHAERFEFWHQVESRVASTLSQTT